MNKTITITKCIGGCPFYSASSGGALPECTHPVWESKPKGSGAIIAGIHRDTGVFPERCPLKKEALTVTYALGQVVA